MNPIDQLLNEALKSDNKEFQRRLFINLQRLVHKIQLNILDSKKRNLGYCSTFIIPEKNVFELFDEIGITKDEINSAFSTQWSVPVEAHMHFHC